MRHAGRWGWPIGLALALSALLLGPALRPGLTLAYDLGWSPDPRLTPFVSGIGMVAPRAVPSDAVGVSLGLLTGAGVAQKAVLLAVLMACALGPIAMLRHVLPGASAPAVAIAGVAGVWNPFVIERLAIGQWTILLGFGVAGFALAALLRWLADPRAWSGVLGMVAIAGLGGANTVVMVLAVALPAAVCGVRTRGLRATAAMVAALLATACGVSAVWALPALSAAATSSGLATTVFAPRSDTPFGVVISLLSGGGMWNAAAHPEARAAVLPAAGATGLALLAVVAAGHAARTRYAVRPLLASGVFAVGVTLAGVVPGVDRVWAELLAALPGGGVLRDSQKLLTGWVLLIAVGSALIAERLVRVGPASRWAAVTPIAVAGLLLAPVALLPAAIWGLGGRLSAVTVPADYRALASTLSAAPEGLVGVLPWNQYRRYPWNGARTALSIAPRTIDQRVLQNDALPTRSGWIAGEDPLAAGVTAAIADGSSPVAALRAAGARYVLIEADAAPTTAVLDADPALSAAVVLARGVSGTAYDLGAVPGAGPEISAGPVRAGWAVTSGTWLLVVGIGIARARTTRRRRIS
jgi:hypothetical protein